jgi:hypothetical protein
MATLTLRSADAAATLSAPRWWELASLRLLLGGQPSTTLGYDAGPDAAAPHYAFLAADVSPAYAPGLKTVRRFFVVLRDRGLLTLDLASGPGPLSWTLEGSPRPKLVHRSILPKSGVTPRQDKVFLNTLLDPSVPVSPLFNVDLAGARAGDDVVLFHSELGMANSALSFDVPGKDKLRILIVGLAPGFWELWKDGFLEDNARLVQPGTGTLYYDGDAGDYFLRHR